MVYKVTVMVCSDILSVILHEDMMGGRDKPGLLGWVNQW